MESQRIYRAGFDFGFGFGRPIKYGLEAVGINYRKATSRRLVLLITRFVQSLSLAILISQKSLGNHPDNLDANALTC